MSYLDFLSEHVDGLWQCIVITVVFLVTTGVTASIVSRITGGPAFTWTLAIFAGWLASLLAYCYFYCFRCARRYQYRKKLRKIRAGDTSVTLDTEVESMTTRKPSFSWDPKSSVGRVIKVYWKTENRWFTGTVKSFSQDEGGMFFVVYEDGDETWVSLKGDKWSWAPEAIKKKQEISIEDID